MHPSTPQTSRSISHFPSTPSSSSTSVQSSSNNSNNSNAIKVCVRIRPPLLNQQNHTPIVVEDLNSTANTTTSYPSTVNSLLDITVFDNSLTIQGKTTDRGIKTNEPLDFHYDLILDRDATQIDVMKNIGDEMVKSSLEGYNGCILTYGQTGNTQHKFYMIYQGYRHTAENM